MKRLIITVAYKDERPLDDTALRIADAIGEYVNDMIAPTHGERETTNALDLVVVLPSDD